MTILDCSVFTRKEVGDALIKAASYGLPTISYYAASQGVSQSDLDCMNFLEDKVLKLKERLIPLMNSATMAGADNTSGNTDGTGEAGRPENDIGELTDAGEQTRERGEE